MNVTDEAVQLLAKNILSAVERLIENAPFDKMNLGKIVDIYSPNRYSVMVEGRTYAIKDDIEYEINDRVWVCKPQNDSDKMFILPQGGGGGGGSFDDDVMLWSLFATNLNAELGYVDKAVIADKLTTSRTITLSGAVSGTTSFDGSQNITILTSKGDSATIAQTLLIPPEIPLTGQVYFDLTDGKFYGFDGSEWIDLGEGNGGGSGGSSELKRIKKVDLRSNGFFATLEDDTIISYTYTMTSGKITKITDSDGFETQILWNNDL